MKKLIQNACKKMYPNQNQIEKMFNSTLDKYENKNATVIVENRKIKVIKKSVTVAVCTAFTIFLGATIYKSMPGLNKNQPSDSAVFTEQKNSSAQTVTPAITEQSSDTKANVQSLDSFIYQKIVNGKLYSIESNAPDYNSRYSRINLIDKTVTAITEPTIYSGPACISGNILYSIPHTSYEEPPVLYSYDINTGKTINKTQVDGRSPVCADKNGNVYSYFDDCIRIYSKDLKLLYSLSNEELSKKINGITENSESDHIRIRELEVSPEGEIFIMISNESNTYLKMCKLNSEHNIVFISDNYYNVNTNFFRLFYSDNGNLIACTLDQDNESHYATIYIKELSSQTGQIIADHGQLEHIYLGSQCELYGDYLIFDDPDTKNICKYNINSYQTENIFYYGDNDQFSVRDILINGDNAIINLWNFYETEDSKCLVIADSEGLVIKEISLDIDSYIDKDSYALTIYDNILDVTVDEKIYFMASLDSKNNSEYTPSIYTIDSDDKPVKLFDLPVLYNECRPPVLSVDSNQNFYLCWTDDAGQATLSVYDNSGNLKSTVNITENISYICRSIVSGSQLILIGYCPGTDQPCCVSVDLETIQPGEIQMIDKNSDVILSEDGTVSFSPHSEDDINKNSDS